MVFDLVLEDIWLFVGEFMSGVVEYGVFIKVLNFDEDSICIVFIMVFGVDVYEFVLGVFCKGGVWGCIVIVFKCLEWCYVGGKVWGCVVWFLILREFLYFFFLYVL